MKKRTLIATAIVLSVFIMATMPAQAQMEKMHAGNVFKTASANELRTSLRTLWEDHGIYTRNVILNIIDDLPGTGEAVDRLFKNQEDIGNAIQPIYGAEAGKKLASLLHDHIVIAADLLKAAKANNDADFKTANTAWFKNADEISSFLNSANGKNWQLKDMQHMMHDHLNLTTQQAVARLKKDYKGDIDAFDKTRAELLEMSDMLASGIVKQFPEKFKN